MDGGVDGVGGQVEGVYLITRGPDITQVEIHVEAGVQLVHGQGHALGLGRQALGAHTGHRHGLQLVDGPDGVRELPQIILPEVRVRDGKPRLAVVADGVDIRLEGARRVVRQGPVERAGVPLGGVRLAALPEEDVSGRPVEHEHGGLLDRVIVDGDHRAGGAVLRRSADSDVDGVGRVGPPA